MRGSIPRLQHCFLIKGVFVRVWVPLFATQANGVKILRPWHLSNLNHLSWIAQTARGSPGASAQYWAVSDRQPKLYYQRTNKHYFYPKDDINISLTCSFVCTKLTKLILRTNMYYLYPQANGAVASTQAAGASAASSLIVAGAQGNHLCKTTRLPKVFFESGEECSKLWWSLTRRNTHSTKRDRIR